MDSTLYSSIFSSSPFSLNIHPQCKALHGDVAQAQRETTLAAFKAGNLRCIVATDVAVSIRTWRCLIDAT